VQRIRNLVHPGAYVCDLPDGFYLDESTFAGAYAVLDNVHIATSNILAAALQRPRAFIAESGFESGPADG
jgi:hypothetical protein